MAVEASRAVEPGDRAEDKLVFDMDEVMEELGDLFPEGGAGAGAGAGAGGR